MSAPKKLPWAIVNSRGKYYAGWESSNSVMSSTDEKKVVTYAQRRLAERMQETLSHYVPMGWKVVRFKKEGEGDGSATNHTRLPD